MIAPYDIEITPCTYFQEHQICISSAFKRRLDAVSDPMASVSKYLDTSISVGERLLTSQQLSDLRKKSNHPPITKWTEDLSSEPSDAYIRISRKVYENLIEQNQAKDRQIAELEARIMLLTSSTKKGVEPLRSRTENLIDVGLENIPKHIGKQTMEPASNRIREVKRSVK